MINNLAVQQAIVLFERGTRQQMKGNVGEAITLYKRSIDLHPTAAAHTYLGWAYSMMDRYNEAIEQCEIAIEIDPDWGNPYNDIGSYLIALERPAEAIEWLEKAIRAPRYESPQFPYVNLGRAYELIGRYRSALNAYDTALKVDPHYLPAQQAKYGLIARMN